MHVEAVGVFCLGLFLGYVCWYFVVRLGKEKVTADTFASVAGVVAGGVVLKLLDKYLSSGQDAWWYPIGLVAGFVAYLIAGLINWFIVKPEHGPMPTLSGHFFAK